MYIYIYTHYNAKISFCNQLLSLIFQVLIRYSFIALILINWDLFSQDFIRNGVVIKLLILVHGILSMFHFWAQKMKVSRYQYSVFGCLSQVSKYLYQYSDTQHSRKFTSYCRPIQTLIEPESQKSQNIKLIGIPLLFLYKFELD